MDRRAPRNLYRLRDWARIDASPVRPLVERLHGLGVDWIGLPPVADELHRALVESIATTAHERGMGVLLDLVPGHVDVSTAGPDDAWWDVLANGRGSTHGDTFEIDWSAGGDKVLLPVVAPGDEGAVVVEGGEVRYHEHRFPLARGTRRLRDQHYRLVERESEDPNYRRGHAQESLVAVRVEDPEVLRRTHGEVLDWVERGLVDGVRICDAADLRDPAGYERDLRALTGVGVVLHEPHRRPAATLEDLGPELRWIVRDLPRRVPVNPSGESGSGFVARMRQRLSGPASLPLGRPDAEVVDGLTAKLATIDARTSRPELGALLDDLEPVLADPEQPAAQRFRLAAAVLTDGSPTTLRIAADVDVCALAVALTGPEMPQIEDPDGVLEQPADSMVRAVTSAALRMRRDRADLFTTYDALETVGASSEEVFALDRGGAVTVCGQGSAGGRTADAWGAVELVLPAGDWWDHVTGRDLGSDGRVYLAELLDLAPVAILSRDER